MVSRFSLTFWRWVVTFHDRLHEVRDKRVMEEFEWGGKVDFTSANVTYTSPSPPFPNRRKDD